VDEINSYQKYSTGIVIANRQIGTNILMPLLCALVTYKFAYHYYILMIPSLSTFFIRLYNVVTLLMLVFFIPTGFMVLLNIRQPKYRYLWPALVIPGCVVLNIFYVMITSGDISILSRSYVMAAAIGTNDSSGFYFAQINTWFGNMAVVLMLAISIKNVKEVINCIVASMTVMVIPILVIIMMHPSYIGLRASTFENVSFGGGLWNIGVIGFGSLSWLSFALLKHGTNRQKRFMVFSTILFVFVGIAGLSRTMVLMIVLSVSFYFLKTKKDIHWVGKVLLVCVMLFFFLFLQSDLLSVLLNRFGDSTSGTQNIRFKLWAAYLSHYDEYWLVGAPLGSVYNYYYDVNLFGRNFLPHSTPLNFLIRYGVFSLFAYLNLIRFSFLSGQKYYENSTVKICILAGCIAYISLVFINQTGFSESVFYIMFGLLLAFSRIAKEEAILKQD
jgi:hypothetical protein